MLSSSLPANFNIACVDAHCSLLGILNIYKRTPSYIGFMSEWDRKRMAVLTLKQQLGRVPPEYQREVASATSFQVELQRDESAVKQHFKITNPFHDPDYTVQSEVDQPGSRKTRYQINSKDYQDPIDRRLLDHILNTIGKNYYESLEWNLTKIQSVLHILRSQGKMAGKFELEESVSLIHSGLQAVVSIINSTATSDFEKRAPDIGEWLINSTRQLREDMTSSPDLNVPVVQCTGSWSSTIHDSLRDLKITREDGTTKVLVKKNDSEYETGSGGNVVVTVPLRKNSNDA